jgi:hypothetical protein
MSLRIAAAVFPRLCVYIAQDLGNCLCTEFPIPSWRSWCCVIGCSATKRRSSPYPSPRHKCLSYTDVYYYAVTRWWSVSLSLSLSRWVKPWMKLWRNERTAESLRGWSVHWLRSITTQAHTLSRGSEAHNMTWEDNIKTEKFTVVVMLNPLKAAGYFMYHQAYRQTILRSAHRVYLCVLCGSQNKQRLFPYTALTDWFL